MRTPSRKREEPAPLFRKPLRAKPPDLVAALFDEHRRLAAALARRDQQLLRHARRRPRLRGS